MCTLQHDGRHLVRPAQFFGPLQGYQPTLPAPPSRTIRVPTQLWALELASDLRSSHAMYFLDHGRLFAADDPSTSPYAANALLPMSVSRITEVTYIQQIRSAQPVKTVELVIFLISLVMGLARGRNRVR